MLGTGLGLAYHLVILSPIDDTDLHSEGSVCSRDHGHLIKSSQYCGKWIRIQEGAESSGRTEKA